MWNIIISASLGLTEITNSLEVSASSFYNVPPYEKSFLPEFAIDNDDSTAWSSLGEGCDAKFVMKLEQPMKVHTICARSRDMVDDPNVPHTNDSVIESFDILLDGKFSTTCILPDWKSVHCCTVPDVKEVEKITLDSKKCRESKDGPNNTGFKTLKVFVEEDKSEIEHMTIVGSENVAEGSAKHVLISGSHMKSSHSDSNILTGHKSRSLSSDESSVMGSEIEMSFSDMAVAVGHELQVQNADKSVAIGSNIVLKTPEQIVLGRYNTPSNSAFVVAAGSSSNTLNLFEINKDGSIKNTHIQTIEERITQLEKLEQRISQLENKLTQALSSCREPNCDSIKTAYITSGCCPVENDFE